MLTDKKQFTIWQLMKAVTIAAMFTYALLPLIRNTDVFIADPILFLTVLVIAMLLQFQIFIPSLIDWILGVKNDNESGK